MSSLSGGQKLLVAILSGIVVVVLVFGFRAWAREQGKIQEVEALRDQMVAARAAADACLLDRARAEVIFEQADQTVDSIRGVVDDAEIPLPEGGRGVDAEAYPAYLTTVEAYNRAVQEWEAAAVGLQQVDARCRTAVEAHNLLADSLTRYLAREGVELPGR